MGLRLVFENAQRSRHLDVILRLTLGLHPLPANAKFEASEFWIAIDETNVPESNVFHMCWTLWNAHDSDLHLATGSERFALHQKQLDSLSQSRRP